MNDSTHAEKRHQIIASQEPNKPSAHRGFLRSSARWLALLVLLALVVLVTDSFFVGSRVDSYRGVDVFHNGLIYLRSSGRHYAPDGYYYGQKWQCVEFIKRFYFESAGHRMPDVMGNAKDYFDPATPPGAVNRRRGMLQFVDGGSERPAPDDLLVFTDGRFGHVAIVSAVSDHQVEVVQQNILGRPRQTFPLIHQNGTYSVASPKRPAGWLRVKRK